MIEIFTKVICKGTIILNGEIVQCFPLISEIQEDVYYPFFNIITENIESPTQDNETRIGIKSHDGK